MVAFRQNPARETDAWGLFLAFISSSFLSQCHGFLGPDMLKLSLLRYITTLHRNLHFKTHIYLFITRSIA